MIKDNGVICTFPFIQMSTTTSGCYQACCVAEEQKEYTFENTTPMQFFNSEFMKKLRADMVGGEMTETIRQSCHRCFDQEKLFNKSKRLDSLEHHIHSSKKVQDAIDRVNNNNNVDLNPQDIDHLKIKVFGNLCNLRCTVCAPSASSALAAELKKYGVYKGPVVQNHYDKIDKDELYSDLEIICPVLREFEIVGGEPLIMDDALEMIEWLVKKQFAKNMEFRIITNASVTNFDFLALMKYFKKTTFIVSLDGYGKKDEYIRNRTVWEEKVEAIDNMIYAGIEVSWSNTIQLLNIGYLDEIHKFYLELKERHPKGKIYAPHMNNLLMYPKYARSLNVPRKIAQTYIDRYNNINFKIDNIETHIKALANTEDDPANFTWAMQTYKWFDEKRGTCLTDEWPEFENYYSNVGGQIFPR
jgi:hypothetical protein